MLPSRNVANQSTKANPANANSETEAEKLATNVDVKNVSSTLFTNQTLSRKRHLSATSSSLEVIKEDELVANASILKSASEADCPQLNIDVLAKIIVEILTPLGLPTDAHSKGFFTSLLQACDSISDVKNVLCEYLSNTMSLTNKKINASRERSEVSEKEVLLSVYDLVIGDIDDTDTLLWAKLLCLRHGVGFYTLNGKHTRSLARLGLSKEDKYNVKAQVMTAQAHLNSMCIRVFSPLYDFMDEYDISTDRFLEKANSLLSTDYTELTNRANYRDIKEKRAVVSKKVAQMTALRNLMRIGEILLLLNKSNNAPEIVEQLILFSTQLRQKRSDRAKMVINQDNHYALLARAYPPSHMASSILSQEEQEEIQKRYPKTSAKVGFDLALGDPKDDAPKKARHLRNFGDALQTSSD